MRVCLVSRRRFSAQPSRMRRVDPASESVGEDLKRRLCLRESAKTRGAGGDSRPPRMCGGTKDGVLCELEGVKGAEPGKAFLGEGVRGTAVSQ